MYTRIFLFVLASIVLAGCASSGSTSAFGPDHPHWWDAYMDETNPPEPEEMPRPVDGAEDLRDRVLHRLGGQQCLRDPGSIVVQFVVDEGGSVVDARILDGIDDGLCDGLAMSVIYDTAFHPAKDAEGPIQMVMNWPLTITLPAAR